MRYRITLTDNSIIEVDNPSRWPDPSEIVNIEEPFIIAKILTNEEYVGNILKSRRRKTRPPAEHRVRQPETRVMLTYELLINEIVLDFYDRLKSVSRGYASLDYNLAGHWISPMVEDGYPHQWRPLSTHSPVIVHRRLRLRSRQSTRLKDARALSRATNV